MHELSVCQALVRQAETIARQQAAQHIAAIRLRIGPLSGIEPHLLEQAYPAACRGTLLENSGLTIEHAPIRVQCRRCGACTDADISCLVCAECGDGNTQLISGDEMLLVDIEIA
jgi:hydrogenase nickel incorporation protein HypA/HybF